MLTFRVQKLNSLMSMGTAISLIALNCNALATDTLISDSPFLPFAARSQAIEKVESQISSPSRISQELVFKGVVLLGDRWEFSVHNSSEKSSYWLGLNEKSDIVPFQIIDFDADYPRILVEWEGSREFLELSFPAENQMLKPRGTIASVDDFPLPYSPPTLSPPSTPPPPPISGPPPGPPPQIPPEVQRRFEAILASRQENVPESEFLSGGFAGGTGGTVGIPPAPPSVALNGIPAAAPTGIPGTGGPTDSGSNSGAEDGGVSAGSSVPSIPGFNPAAGPPSGPPNIDIPDIPNVPSGDG